MEKTPISKIWWRFRFHIWRLPAVGVAVSCHKQTQAPPNPLTFFTRIFTMAFKAKPALSAAGAASASTSSPASAVAALKAKTTAPVSLKESNKGLRGTRRRLSVVSDNKLIEGRAAFCMVSCSFHPTAARTAPCVACVVAEFAKMTFGCDAPSGIATLGVGEEEKTEEHKIEHVIKTYAGVSKKVRALWYPQCPAWLT
jgi:hypothetical protein